MLRWRSKSLRETSGGNFAAAVASLEARTNGVNGNLEVTINSLPISTNLSNINHTSSTLTIRGRAPSEEEVLSYLRELEKSGRFSSITITNMKRVPGASMDFALVLGVGE